MKIVALYFILYIHFCFNFNKFILNFHTNNLIARIIFLRSETTC